MQHYHHLIRWALLVSLLFLPTAVSHVLGSLSTIAEEGPLFERVSIPGVTDWPQGTNGLAIADLNRDGLLDLVMTNEDRVRRSDRLRVFLNQGNMRFTQLPITITNASFTADDMGDNAQVPNLVDFNRDGFLDILVTRHRGGTRARPLGNTLLLSQGRLDMFADVSDLMSIRNQEAYNRQTSIGDVNKDGWLDIAVGADNIGKPECAGFPIQRLYIFLPGGPRFEDGKFEDIGGTELIPNFGGPFRYDPQRDRGGPDIDLRDLDNDGDLDLIQGYHNDMNRGCAKPGEPGSSGESVFGIFVWRNLLAEKGTLRFEHVTDNGLAEAGQVRWNPQRRCYEVVQHAVGLPYLSFADTDNDGLLDVLAVGPTAPTWHTHSDQISGRFWRNLGDFQFRESTDAAGLTALNWTYRQWHKFWNFTTPPQLFNRPPSQLLCGEILARIDYQFYAGDAVFGDFDNDGWQDLVVIDRRERSFEPSDIRGVLFMNNGDGTFHPTTTEFSGLDANGIAAEAADLNNDGLLDLFFIADPNNSGGNPATTPQHRYFNKVFLNTGRFGARSNHWVRVRFSGISDAELIGARVEAYNPSTGKLLAMRSITSNPSYKSAGPLEAHFGLGTINHVDLKITLLDQRVFWFRNIDTDQLLDLDLSTMTLTTVSTR